MEKLEFPIIDAWANPVLELESTLPEVHRLFAQSHVPAVLSKPITPSEYVALMDEAGISRVCLTAWYRPGKAVFSNAQVAQFVDAYPDRFVGIAGVDLTDPVAACREVEKWCKPKAEGGKGFKGVRVVPWLWSLPPSDRHYWPILVKCVELDVPFLTQVGHTGPLCPSEVGRPVPYIDEIALKFPALKIICGHLGYPWTQEMIGVAWKHENVFIDTSAYIPKYYPPELIQFANTIGRSKVMFGTNFPQLQWKNCIKSALQDIKLRDFVKEGFFGGNAARVLKLDIVEKGATSKL